MKKSEMRTKLYETLQRLGISNPADWQDHIDKLLGKLEFLNDLGRYDGLLKTIFLSNDRSNFNSFAFEAAFAYDFEFNGHQLKYEVNILPDSPTSIDYCYETEGGNIYFEKSNHFRETIHGVLFVKNASRGVDPKYLVDLKLQYFLVGNNTILEKKEYDAIIEKLSSFSPTWSDNK